MSLDVGLLAKGLEADQRADRIDAWRKWGRGKIRRVRTPEGARFYGAPIGTPIVADPKTGKLKAVRALPAPDPTEDPLTFSKIRRVRTPEGAKFYNAPIGTPIVADKATGKLRALTTAKLPQAPLLKDWKPGDPTDRIKAQITDVVRGVLDEAGLPEGTLTVSVKPASTLSKLTVAVRYSRPDDYKKASVALHRQIYPSERKVHNWQFSVAKDLQGHGIGAKMTAALEDLWRSEGIETVTVGANADVGGYAWARLGFEFKDPAQAAEFVSDAQKQITKYAPIWAKKVSPEYVEDVKAQVQALQERLDAGDTILPAEIAMLGYREGLDDPPFYWLGKRVLLGTSWDGVKDLGRPKVQMVKTKRVAQRTSKIRTDRKIPVSDPLTVQDIQRLAALEDEDPQRYFDLLDEDVQDRLWEAAQKSPVGRASDPVWRDWWYHRFEAEDLPPKPPRGRWTVQEGEYPDTETRLRNESGDTILSEVPLTERQQQLLVQDFDFLLSKVPPSTFENVKHGHLGLVIPAQDGTFGADKVEGVDWNTFGAINGYVIDKIPVINLNPELLNRIEPTSGPYSGPHGYGFEITNSLRGVMAHEMGHVIDFANGHTASQSQQDWQQVIDTAYGVILNEHTRKDPQETYAELFGMWVMGFKDYDTGLLDKYAQQFGWEQPDDAVLTLSREDEVRSKVRSVQKVKDTLTDIDVGLRTGVRARIEKAVGDYFAYARQIGINNPMLSPAEVFARADVQALWAQEAASLHSWLANRISEGFYKGADLGRSGDAHGVLDEGYLDAVNQDLTNYLATLDSQVRAAVWNAYNQIDWVPSYAQGGTSTNVPHDTAVKRWDTASDSQSAVVTDISRRAHAGISAATHRGYTEGQLSTITDTSMLKMWVANFAQPPERGPCLTCIALHGMTIPVTEQFPAEVTYAAKPLGVYRDLLGPPRHPNCRCKLVFFAAGQEHEPVSKKMNEYAMDVVTSTMATTGFTAKQVRALPEPLFERLWRFLMRGGWWKRLWKRLRSG